MSASRNDPGGRLRGGTAERWAMPERDRRLDEVDEDYEEQEDFEDEEDFEEEQEDRDEEEEEEGGWEVRTGGEGTHPDRTGRGDWI